MNGKVKLFCCKTMFDEIEALKPDNLPVEYIEYALHRTPDKLREELQRHIDEEQEADTLVFVYGLCSRGLDGLQARDKTLVIPRVHDCISLLLGSRQKYNQEFEENPGTYFLSKGWIDQEADPYKEYIRYREQYGEKNARWIMHEYYKNYKRITFIDTNLPDLQDYEKYAHQAADFLGAECVKRQGDSRFFKKIVSGDWDNGDQDNNFVIILPGQVSRYQHFM